MSRIYLDACVIIYLIEAGNPFHDSVTKRLTALGNEPGTLLLTSQLSRLECRVLPMKQKNDRLLASYDHFFDSDRLLLIEVTSAIVDRATRLRADYGFRTPDAIHLASAIHLQSDILLTGDPVLKRCPEIQIEVLT